MEVRRLLGLLTMIMFQEGHIEALSQTRPERPRAEKRWTTCALKYQQVMSPTTEDMEMRRRRTMRDEPSIRDELSDEVRSNGDDDLEVTGREIVPVAQGGADAQTLERFFSTPVQGGTEREPESRLAGRPQALEPVLPLFSEEQVSQMEAWYRRSPMLYPNAEGPRRSEHLPSTIGKGRGQERLAVEDVKKVPPLPERYELATRASSASNDQDRREEASWRRRMEREFQKMELQLRASQEENRSLRKKLRQVCDERDGDRGFHTPEEEKRAEGTSSTPAQGKGVGAPRSDGRSDKTMDFMMLMLQSMQELQKSYMENGAKSSPEVEVVRSGVGEFPILGDWDPIEAPLRMGDWLAVLDPLISDLSETSEEWWRTMMEEVAQWYRTHMSLSPLDRASHSFDAPASLVQRRWQRLEKRVAGMLIKAVPEGVREDLVSNKRLSAFSMLAALQVIYQPGGQGEKTTLLKALEDPPEAQSAGDAVLALRRWIRWRKRALEIHAVEPDPTVLVRGLTKITCRILEMNQELRFRVSLARTTLLIDSAPDRDSVAKFATHLLAEIEQVAYSDRKATKSSNKQGDAAKLKKFGDGEKGEGKGRAELLHLKEAKVDEEPVKEGGQKPCKFYLTESGCKRGKACKWPHISDGSGTKRCFNCGSTKHFAQECPYSGQKAKSTAVEPHGKPRAEAAASSQEPEKASADAVGEDRMKRLLEEANDMLQGFSKKASVQNGPSLEQLQAQLDELKKRGMKTLKLTRLQAEETPKYGLIDSGATNPLRPLLREDDLTQVERVWVSLADGQRTPMLLNNHGVMVSTNLNIEPIVPMGWLTSYGCEVIWTDGTVTVKHPTRGDIQVRVEMGCPQVDRDLALSLIQDFEKGGGYPKKVKKAECSEESATKEDVGLVQWMMTVLEEHPVLRILPDHIKSQLVTTPGELKNLPVNQHKRKRLKEEGYVLHLYAGASDGFRLETAFQEAGLRHRTLEIDIQRGERHDVLEESLYAALLRSALLGHIRGVVGGPNCRTRSVLRHYPKPGAPRPVRSWDDNQEYGLADLTATERKAVEEDDLLMWRMQFIYVISDLVIQATRPGGKGHMLLEQPAAPGHMPQCVSFWRTREWKKMKEVHSLDEQTFNQGDYVPGVEAAVKPTTVGGTLSLDLPERRNYRAKSREDGEADSKALARWNPGLCRAIARACSGQIFATKYFVKQLSWQQHVECGHTPFRRDCRVCQESSAKARPHRSVPHPLCGVLSVDITGPLCPSKLNDDRMRYILVGAFTWIKPVEVPVPADAILPEVAEAELLLEDESGDAVEEAEEGQDPEEVDACLEESDGHEMKEGFEMVTYRLAVPMASRNGSEVLSALHEIYMQLRIMGYPLTRLHSDRAREFISKNMTEWCRNRNVIRTTTPSQDSQMNGRAERAVQEIKMKIRRTLMSAGWNQDRWAYACLFVNEIERRRMTFRGSMELPGFGEEVLVKKKI